MVKMYFTVGQGLWQFTVMPFDLYNALATFESLMETVLRGLTYDSCPIYLDDMIVIGFVLLLYMLHEILHAPRDFFKCIFTKTSLSASAAIFGTALCHVVSLRAKGLDVQRCGLLLSIFTRVGHLFVGPLDILLFLFFF
jgi:hypothetical protein